MLGTFDIMNIVFIRNNVILFRSSLELGCLELSNKTILATPTLPSDQLKLLINAGAEEWLRLRRLGIYLILGSFFPLQSSLIASDVVKLLCYLLLALPKTLLLMINRN